jgi:hypothetical protein
LISVVVIMVSEQVLWSHQLAVTANAHLFNYLFTLLLVCVDLVAEGRLTVCNGI